MRILTSLRKFLPVLRKEFGLRFLTSPCPAGLARRRPRSGGVAAGVLRACVSEGAPWPLAATRLAGFLEERVTWSACLAPPHLGRTDAPHPRQASLTTLLCSSPNPPGGGAPGCICAQRGQGAGQPWEPAPLLSPVPPAWPGPAQPGLAQRWGSSSRGLRRAGAEMPLPLTSFFLGHIFPSQGQSMEQAREDHSRLLISPACLLPHLPLPFLLLSVFSN